MLATIINQCLTFQQSSFTIPQFSLRILLAAKTFVIINVASRGSAAAQVGVVGQVRFIVGMLVSARSVTTRMCEQCLCKAEGELERQHVCAVIRLLGVLTIIISEMPVIQCS